MFSRRLVVFICRQKNRADEVGYSRRVDVLSLWYMGDRTGIFLWIILHAMVFLFSYRWWIRGDECLQRLCVL